MPSALGSFGRVENSVSISSIAGAEELPMLITGIAQADVILESATLGITGQTGGVSISNSQFIGAHFEVTETTTVECIGGHMYGSGTNVFNGS